MTKYSYRGLPPHQFMPMSGVHNRLQATPESSAALRGKLRGGAPEPGRWRVARACFAGTCYAPAGRQGEKDMKRGGCITVELKMLATRHRAASCRTSCGRRERRSSLVRASPLRGFPRVSRSESPAFLPPQGVTLNSRHVSGQTEIA